MRGTAGNVLTEIVDGTLQEDKRTVVINKLHAASLAGCGYRVGENAGIRANDPLASPILSISGAKLDFWICPQGFNADTLSSGGDCPFRQ